MPTQLKSRIVRKAEGLQFLDHKMFVKTKNQERKHTHTQNYEQRYMNLPDTGHKDIHLFIF